MASRDFGGDPLAQREIAAGHATAGHRSGTRWSFGNNRGGQRLERRYGGVAGRGMGGRGGGGVRGTALLRRCGELWNRAGALLARLLIEQRHAARAWIFRGAAKGVRKGSRP